MKPSLFALVGWAVLTMPTDGHPAEAVPRLAHARATNHPSATAECWKAPPPQTLEEIVATATNPGAGSAPARKPATLALSSPSEPHKAAYGAGLLVGWGETGKRPDFSVVTAVGMSALIAPFAFLGAEGDRKIADLFACGATSFQDMAERAAAYIDAGTLEKLARKHDQGARLLVALPGSAARRETVWDIGMIAASRHPKAETYIKNILLAAVDLTTFIDPATVPLNAGVLAVRNSTFRQIGAGEPFLTSRSAGHPHAATYLIHNGVLFPDEGERYMTARSRAASEAVSPAETPVVAAYDFFLAARASGTAISIASPRPHLNILPAQEFDMTYLRALFVDAYRHGRMSKEWRRTLKDRSRSYP